MAKAGDYYITTLRPSHLDWGEYRNTLSRDSIPGEAYLAIPIGDAKRLQLFNGNGTSRQDILGKNIFRFRTADGYLNGFLRAQGSSSAGSIYAKQFSVDKNLKELGTWFDHISAIEGTQIKVEWTSPYDVVLSVF
jgi:hypothetical protein